MINHGSPLRLGLKIRSCKSIDVRWWNDGGLYQATEVVTTNLTLWTSGNDRPPCSLGPRTYLVAPLRVDVILGLPFIRWMDNSASKISLAPGREGLAFKKGGIAYSVLARPTHRRWQGPHCNAAHLRSFLPRPRKVRGTIPRQGSSPSPLSDGMPLDAPMDSWFHAGVQCAVVQVKRFGRLMRKNLFTSVCSVHIRPAHEELGALAPEPDADPLADVAADHPLRQVLEKYRLTLFKEQTTLPPDRARTTSV